MKNRQIYSEFCEILNKLVGIECWSVIAGKGTGSHVHVGFGAKIPREKPLRNTLLSEDERNFEPEFTLFVTEASWRVENDEAVLCTYTDENTGKRYKHLKSLAGKKVVRAETFFPSFDLFLTLEGGVCFKVFSTLANDSEEYLDYDNYMFFTQNLVYKVGGRSEVLVENI